MSSAAAWAAPSPPTSWPRCTGRRGPTGRFSSPPAWRRGTRPRGTWPRWPGRRSPVTPARRPTTGPSRRSPRRSSPRLLGVLGVLAGATDHDLVLLDRDLNGPVTGPVLGVHGIILDGGI